MNWDQHRLTMMNSEQCDGGVGAQSRQCVGSHGVSVPKVKEDEMDLGCEWKDCQVKCKTMCNFIQHVSEHIVEYLTAAGSNSPLQNSPDDGGGVSFVTCVTQ